MIGLFGVITHKGRPVSDQTLTRMRKHAVHFGPSAQLWREDPATFVFSEAAHAPDFVQTEDLAVFLCGWIEAPATRPHEPVHHTSRAQALVDLWRARGVDLAGQLEGEYVAVIYERKSHVTHILRDANGTHSMYWARAPGRFAFASTPHPLLELSWVSRELARENLAEYLAFRTVHAPRTLLRDVAQLPARHRLRIDPSGVRTVRVSTPKFAPAGAPHPPVDDVLRELKRAVDEAMHRRLVGESHVGVYLSGGAGSTALVAAARALDRSLHTFTVTVSEEPSPESPFAGRIAKLLGMVHHTVSVSSEAIADEFDRTAHVMGAPVGNVAAVLQYHLARAVGAEGIDTVLTGDGADQLFGGRKLQEPARLLRHAQQAARLPWPVRSMLGQALAPLGRGERLRATPEQLVMQKNFGSTRLISAGLRRELLVDDTLIHPAIRHDILAPIYAEVSTDPLNMVLHAFFQSVLLNDTIPRVQSTANAHGLVAGFPLLDAEVRRLAQLLPGSFKIRGVAQHDLQTRWLLRAVLPSSLPSALIQRIDRGLPRPLDDWLTRAGRPFFEARFQALRNDPLGLWHTTGLEALRHRLVHDGSSAPALWALFMLDAWLKDVRAN